MTKKKKTKTNRTIKMKLTEIKYANLDLDSLSKDELMVIRDECKESYYGDASVMLITDKDFDLLEDYLLDVHGVESYVGSDSDTTKGILGYGKLKNTHWFPCLS